MPLVYLDERGIVRLVRQQEVAGLGRMKTLPKCGKGQFRHYCRVSGDFTAVSGCVICFTVSKPVMLYPTIRVSIADVYHTCTSSDFGN